MLNDADFAFYLMKIFLLFYRIAFWKY